MKSPKCYGSSDVEFNKYARSCCPSHARAVGSFQIALFVLFVVLILALLSAPAGAQINTTTGYSSVPLSGWSRGVGSAGQTIWVSPAVAAKASVGSAIWNSAVPPSKNAIGTWSGSLPFGTAKAAATMKGAITPAAVFSTFRTIAGGPIGVGVAAITTLPAIIDWLALGGVRVTPTGGYEVRDITQCSVGPCYEYSVNSTNVFGENKSVPFTASLTGACSSMATALKAGPYSYTVLTCSYPSASFRSDDANHTAQGTVHRREVPPVTPIYTPATIEEIRAQMELTPSTSAAIDAITGRGGSIPISYAPSDGAVPLSGPASVSGVPVVSSSTSGDVTTTTTTTPKTDVTYGTGTDPATGRLVPSATGSTNSVVVVTTTNNVTGAVTTTNTSTTNTPAVQAEPAPDPCDSNPDRVGCLNIDTPEGVIPKVSKDVTYTPETMFSDGACPADRTVHQALTGKPIVLSYAYTCSALASYVKPIIIAIALMMAYMIILPGNRE